MTDARTMTAQALKGRSNLRDMEQHAQAARVVCDVLARVDSAAGLQCVVTVYL